MPATPASPPKRMTRARAKAVEEKKAPAKAAGANVQKTTASSRARAKTASKDADQPVDNDVKAKEPVKKATATKQKPAEPPKTRSRPTTRTATTKATTGQAHEITPASTEELDELSAPPAASTRTRARKNTLTKDPPKSSTSRTAGRATKTIKVEAPVKPTATKKKVAFHEADKENKVDDVILKRPDSKDGKSDNEETTVNKCSNKKQPADSNVDTADNENTLQLRSEPLSPKKGFQTALPPTQPNSRPRSSGKDSTTTDTRLTSPAKKPMVVRVEDEGEDDELQNASNSARTPTKSLASTALASPPKRPPPSVQGDLKFETASAMAAEKTHSDNKDASDNTTLLLQSPKKLGSLAAAAVPHLQKPQRAGSDVALAMSPPRRPPSPLKTFARPGIPATPIEKSKSLLHSPARRPPSTVQAAQFGSTRKAYEGHARPVTASRLQQKPHKFNMPPPKNPFASPERLRAAAEQRQISLGSPIDRSPAAFSEHADDATCKDNQEAKGSPTVPFEFDAPSVQWSSDAESEDELQSRDIRYETSPTRRQSLAPSKATTSPSKARTSPSSAAATPVTTRDQPALPMTALAEKFGAWTGATPDPNVMKSRSGGPPMFSVPKSASDPFLSRPSTSPSKASSLATGTFDEAMKVHEDDEEDELMDGAANDHQEYFRTSQISDASQEYGDENVPPADPALSQPMVVDGPTCAPADVFPKRQTLGSHNVSKVPLKPASDEDVSRPKPPRSKSMSGAVTPLKPLNLRDIQTARTTRFVEDLPESRPRESPQTPAGSPRTDDHLPMNATPARTPRAQVNPHLLSGAVVFVDVHTTEGADASEIFVELLQQMGARCVKQWTWSPFSSLSDQSDDDQRVGITHVVFKDGGVRTMEKVREAKGVVQCVGVSWVLDCERENRWMDESEYAIDGSTIPRGGHRRRKSMEPKLFSNTNGTLSSTSSPRKLSGSLSPNMGGASPAKEFLNLESPEKQGQRSLTSTTFDPGDIDRRVSFAPLPMRPSPRNEDMTTPVRLSGYKSRPVSAFGTPPEKGLTTTGDFENSPTTPYFLHNTRLVQQTCPPKQTQQLFFPVSGDIEEEQDPSVRQKLLSARRKSLHFAPRVGSPLAKDLEH